MTTTRLSVSKRQRRIRLLWLVPMFDGAEVPIYAQQIDRQLSLYSFRSLFWQILVCARDNVCIASFGDEKLYLQNYMTVTAP